MLYSILVAVDVLLAISIIGLVLIQQGKGASVGAAFGSGASGTVFGSRGSASFLTRATAFLVALFFINSLALAYLASHRPVAESVITTTQEITDGMPAIKNAVEDIPNADAQVPQIDMEATDLPNVHEMESDAATAADSMESMSENLELTPADVPE
jgi:preprotein translocase subunit SecG